MSLIDDHCCPGESVAHNCHGPVIDGETLVLAIRRDDHWKRGANGELVLTRTAISEDDLKGKGSGKDKRGVSFEREECAGPENLYKRMNELTGADDPLVARSNARQLRDIKDAKGVRELCVHADPTDHTDRHGPSPTHGVFRARESRAPVPTGLTWANLRSEIAEQFRARIAHLSGREPD